MELPGYGFAFPFESALMAWLQSFFGASGIKFISLFSFAGAELTVVFFGFLYWSYDKKMGKYVGLNILMALVWHPMIKNIVMRRRPYFDYEDIDIYLPPDSNADIYDISAQGYSFPSGHSSNAVSFFGSAAMYDITNAGDAGLKKKRTAIVAAVVLSFLVGFSRVIVGAHYPTDVICGWILGIAVIFLVPRLRAFFGSTLKLYVFLLVVSLPGLLYCTSADYYTAMGALMGFMAGTLFEERFVQFENTRNPLFSFLRVAIGLAVYFALNTILKLPFSKDFLHSGVHAALIVRCMRYTVVSFVCFGVYPMTFRFLTEKNDHNKTEEDRKGE